MLRLASALACLVLTVSACQSEDEPEAEPTGPAEESVRSGLVQLWTADDATASAVAEGECFAEALLDRLSTNQLVASGVVDSSGAVVDALPTLDETTAEAWVDAQFECSDYVEASTRAVAAQSKGRIDQDAYAECLRAAITDEQIREAVKRTLGGSFDNPEVALLGESQTACVGRAMPAE